MTVRYHPCCGRPCTLLDQDEFLLLIRRERPLDTPRGVDHKVWDYDDWIGICSPSCLVEYAWKLKESQPKLSKSKLESE